MDLPKTWRAVTEKEADGFEKELCREVPESHVLFGKKIRCVARRVDRDDFAFEYLESEKIAKVHLTWQKESDPRWPSTEEYESLEALLQDDDRPLNPHRRF